MRSPTWTARALQQGGVRGTGPPLIELVVPGVIRVISESVPLILLCLNMFLLAFLLIMKPSDIQIIIMDRQIISKAKKANSNIF